MNNDKSESKPENSAGKIPLKRLVNFKEILPCNDFLYFRAYLERLIAPGYSTCGKCHRPWKFVDGHSTPLNRNSSCFPLCEGCWTDLETSEKRMPFYRKLWLEWQAWGDNTEWKDIENAVLAES